MSFKKSTKGTHVYEAVDAADAVGTVYVDRSALPKDPPAAIILSIVIPA